MTLSPLTLQHYVARAEYGVKLFTVALMNSKAI